MGTSLTGLTPATTYDALIKVGDNGPLSATAKVLSDGLGNDSVLALSTTLVGIGTTTPSSLLHISQASANTILRIGNNAAFDQFIYFNGNTDWSLGVDYSNSNAFVLSNASSVGTSDRVAITTAGNVGIGTTAPSGKLSVGGTQGSTIGSNVALLLGNTGDAAAVGNLIQIGLHYNPDGSTISTAMGSVITSSAGFTKSDIFFATRDVTTDTAPTERMRITADGYVRLTTNSGGIQFNGDTAAANALDDYEEGTWTPVIRGSSTAGTYELASAVAAYTKIGRQVTVTAQIVTAGSVTGGGSGYAQITGLPFNNANQAVGAIYVSSVDFSGSYLSVAFISSSGQNTVYLVETNDNSGATDLPISAVAATRGFNFTLTYFV